MKRRRPGRLTLHSKPRGNGWEACQALKCWKNGTRPDVSLGDWGKLGSGVCSENRTDIKKSAKAESKIGPFYYTNDKRHFVGV